MWFFHFVSFVLVRTRKHNGKQFKCIRADVTDFERMCATLITEYHRKIETKHVFAPRDLGKVVSGVPGCLMCWSVIVFVSQCGLEVDKVSQCGLAVDKVSQCGLEVVAVRIGTWFNVHCDGWLRTLVNVAVRIGSWEPSKCMDVAVRIGSWGSAHK